jgi:hypothetical protein
MTNGIAKAKERRLWAALSGPLRLSSAYQRRQSGFRSGQIGQIGHQRLLGGRQAVVAVPRRRDGSASVAVMVAGSAAIWRDRVGGGLIRGGGQRVSAAVNVSRLVTAPLGGGQAS